MVVAPLVIDLGVLLTFLVALGLCLLAKQLIGGMLNGIASLVGHIPLLGGITSSGIHKIEQHVTNALGTAAAGLQARIGGVYHSAARLVEETGQKIEDAYRLIGGVAGILELFVPYREVLALYHALAKAIARLHGTTHEQTKAIAHTARAASDARHRADTAQVRAQAIPADVVIPRDLSGLRGRVREAEQEIARLWDRVRGIAPGVIGGVALGALTLALGRLGIGWARCSNVGKVGRRICGLDQNLLESLLLDTIAIVGSVSVVEFIRDAQAVENVALGALSGFIREFPKV
jgi:hypothetical protein